MKIICLSVVFLSINALLRAQSPIVWDGSGADLSANSYGNLHPRSCTDRAGNPLVVWGRWSDEGVMFSRWDGNAFTTPVKLNPGWMGAAAASWMGPDIAAHGDTVYVVAKRAPEETDTNYIYLFRSFDGGENFDEPVRVDAIGDSLSWLPTVSTDALGNPQVAFMKFNSSFLDSRWVVARSTDYGATFSPDQRASGWNGSAEVCDCCPGALVSEGSTTAMLYRNNQENIRDIWMGVSSNSGAEFTAGCNIDNNNWLMMSCPSSGPDGVIVGDTLHAVFMNGGEGDNFVYYSKSSLSNVTNGSVSRITESFAGLNMQNYPRIARNGSAVAIVWMQIVNSTVQLPILFTEDISQGLPAVYDTVDLGNITNMDVVIGNGQLFVFWQDGIAGTVKFRRGIFGEGLSLEENPDLNLFSLYPNPVKDELTIVYPAGTNRLTVSDLSGKVVLTQDNLPGTKQVLDLSGWERGVYFLGLQSGQSLYTQKVIRE